MKKIPLKYFLLFGIVLLFYNQSVAQEVPFTPRLNENGDNFVNIRGGYTFLSNSVMNRVLPDGSGVNTPYNGAASNNSLHIEYVDIDSDPTTFSSSSSTLSLPECSRIHWAGLYWAGNYDAERKNDNGNFNSNFTVDLNRFDTFNEIKLKVPGGNYVDIIADNAADPVGEEDDIIIDGFNTTPNDPYVCFKNVTNQLKAIADPNGEYFVANVRGTRGSTSHGSAGWTLVVIFENPTMPGQFISVFDGYEGITTQAGNRTADITVSGFNTIPVGPVLARVGVSALEGESFLDGDTFGIISNSNSTFTDIQNAANPNDNFFNSTITNDGINILSRNINSINAIGFDSDVFDLNNPGNSIIDNGDTSATLRLGTNGDWFASFLVTFAVEIIEPSINLEKRVKMPGTTGDTLAEGDITGQGVNLGQILDYVLRFENIGNDDAVNYTIRDVLPINVTLDESNITLPPGVTYTYNPAIREIVFTIPDNLVESSDPLSEIRMRVQVAANCFDFVDACTDLIQNLAFSTYQGVINSAVISDDPSVFDFDACGFPSPGATNFLLDDLEACDFSRTVELCGEELILDAGNDFDAYFWYVDENADGIIDAGDTLIPGANTDILVVTEPGVYIVDKQVADPCKSFQEVITVILFGETQSNPITALINDTSNTVEGQILICSNDGEELPEIFLCGLNDTELIQINIPDADSIEWELLDESSCAEATEGCANRNNTCDWNIIETGSEFMAVDAGQYRLVINYPNGCFTRFYFNIFKNLLDPQLISNDIICDTSGNITVTNIPLDYEFQLVNANDDSIIVPYGANNGPSFTINTNGLYRVEIRQLGVSDGCVFVLDDIAILDRDFQVDVEPNDTDCNGLGEIAISILNVNTQYYYEVSQGGTTIDTYGPSNDNNHTFENLNDGIYDILATTDDGCRYTEQVTIEDFSDLSGTAVTIKNIDCTDGEITVTGIDGNTTGDYGYAIWSYNGTDLYTGTDIADQISNIPGSAYQIGLNNIFTFTNGEEGDYEFIIIDANNCYAISNVATIVVGPSVEYTTAFSNQSCFDTADGSVSVNITNTNGYTVSFSLLDTANNIIANNTSGSFTGLAQGNYTIRIEQALSGSTEDCFFLENFTVSAPTAVTGNAVLTQEYTCVQEGIIEVTSASGGIAPYEYSIDGSNFDGSTGAEIFNNLTDGTYNISIRDANGCVFVTPDITIAPLNPPTDLTFTASDQICPALTSDVTATVTNGDAPFVFEIIAPSALTATSSSGNTASFNALAPNTYIFRVTDAKNCIYEESFTINQTPQITVNGQLIENISCFAATDGAARFTVANFAASFDYTVSGPSNFAGTAETNGAIDLTGLDSGNYTITVTDNDTNCSATASVIINAPPTALAITNLDITDLTCSTSGSVPGSVTVAAANGWGGYEYELTDPSGTITGPRPINSFPGLTDTSGNYTITVRDAGGCEVSQTFNLTPTVSPVLNLTANSLCYDSSVGLELTAAVSSGGVAPFQYRLTGGAYQSRPIFTGLGPGNYTVEVIDGRNCTASASIAILPTLNASASLVKDYDCTASPDAEIEISILGGNPAFTYEVFLNGVPFQASTAVPSVPFSYFTNTPGAYTFSITDSESCTFTTSETIVTDNIPPVATPIVTDVSCFGNTDAVVHINIDENFGIPPYTISFNGSPFTPTRTYSGLGGGSYPFTVRDSKSCEFTGSANVTVPLEIQSNMTATNVTCDPATGASLLGSLNVTITQGGVPNFTYTLFDSSNTIVDTAISASTTHTFNNLNFGDYHVRIIDANGCESDLGSVRVNSNPLLNLTDSPLPSDCITGGTIEVTASGGSGNYDFEIFNGGPGPTTEITTTPDAEVATFTGLNPGQTYIIRAQDNTNGCISFLEVTIPSISTMSVVVDDSQNLTCVTEDDGIVNFTVDNYDASVTSINWEVLNALTNTPLTGAGTYTGTIGPGPAGGPQTGTISDLPPGDYVLVVREASFPSCSTTTAFRITEPSATAVFLTTQGNANCFSDAEVTVRALGGTPPYAYAYVLSGGAVPTVFPETQTFTLDPALGLVWDVYAQDANGCLSPPLIVTVTVDTFPEISTTLINPCAEEGNFDVDMALSELGVPPYRVSIDGNASQPTTLANVGDVFRLSNLSSGNHTIQILDANGCGELENITIFPELQLTATPHAQPTCGFNDGIINYTLSGGSGLTTVQLLRTDTTNTGIVPAGGQFVGVPFGNYIVRVTDNILGSPNCFTDALVTLEEPTPVTLLATQKTDVSCAGETDGTITVNLAPLSLGVNDNSPYIYEITDGTNTFTQNNGLFTGLSDGTYDITVTSNRNCIATDQITINVPLALGASVTNSIEFSCNTTNAIMAASIEVSISSGTGVPGYSYSVNGSAFIPTGGNLFTYNINAAGNYDIVIRDANGCLFTLPTQTIQPLNTFTVDISSTPITCVSDESLTLTVMESSPSGHSYTFELLPLGNTAGTMVSSTTTTADFNLNAPGSYTFRTTNTTTGCYVDTLHTIAPFDLIEVEAIATTPVTCFNDNSGELTITISGYSGGYHYEVFDLAGNSVQTGNNTITNLVIGGLNGGNYFVRVTETDAGSTLCSDDSNSVTIISPTADLVATPSEVAPPTCTNDQGEIAIAITGGYPPYDISMTNTTTGQIHAVNDILTHTFKGLSAGMFNITVTDDNNCIRTYTETLVAPIPVSANISATPLLLACFGDTNATVSAISVSNGSGSYLYQLNEYANLGDATPVISSGFQSSPDFNNLGAGIYNITVSDGWECDVTTNQIQIEEPTEVSPNLIQSAQLTCTTNAELQLSATEGTAPYFYYDTTTSTWAPFNNGNSHTFTNVVPGDYQYVVRDANDCEVPLSNQITVEPIPPLTIAIDGSVAFIACSGEASASIIANVSGGLGNYNYELYTDAALTNLVAGPQLDNIFSGLPANSYYVRVISGDCEEVSGETLITDPAPLQVDREEFTNITCPGLDDGTVIVEVSGGTGQIQYAISPNLNQFDTVNTFADLAAGIYDVIAQDNNGCFITFQFTIEEPIPISLNAVTITTEQCLGDENGSVEIAISGGTAPYSAAFDSNLDADFVTGQTFFTDLAAGEYVIYVRDALGCEENITVEIGPGVNLNASVTPVYECSGIIPNNFIEITLEDETIASDVLYAIDSTDLSAMSINPDFANLSPGTHFLAIAHVNGCINTIEFEIEAFEPLTLTADVINVNEITAIATGGVEDYTFYFDGINNGSDNTYMINRTNTYTVRVVDQNGCELSVEIFAEFIDIEIPDFFTPDGDGDRDFWAPENSEGFPNILTIIFDRYGRELYRMELNDAPWNGVYQSRNLPSGDYWYIIKLRGENDPREIVGHFTLYR